MESSFRLISRKGLMKESVLAINIKSYADARHLGPFVDADGNPVYWKSWSKKKNSKGRFRRSHFSKYPFNTVRGKIKQIELSETGSVIGSEGIIHRKARVMLCEYLEAQIQKGSQIKWAFKNPELSQFSFTGNLLEQVVKVKSNYRYDVKEFGISFEYDIALLGPIVNKEPIILGVIEIEKTHRFEQIKLLASKCLSFPVVSINIEGCSDDDITAEWCEKSIRETRNNSDDERRRNFIYLHDMLVPFYLDIPLSLQVDGKHSLIIFCKDSRFDTLFNYLKKYREILGFDSQSVIHLDKVTLNSENERSTKMFSNEGSIAGEMWEEYNANRYIRVTLASMGKKQGRLLLFSHILARLVNTYADAIVGYKYSKGIRNDHPINEYWEDSEQVKIAPKTLSEPFIPVLEFYKKYGLIEQIMKTQGSNSEAA